MKLPGITNEQWLIALLIVGPPLIAYLYLDWRASLAAFFGTQIILATVKERYGN